MQLNAGLCVPNEDRQVSALAGILYVHEYHSTIHTTSALELYFPLGVENIRDHVLLLLLCQTASELCFNTLRTKEQLGSSDDERM